MKKALCIGHAAYDITMHVPNYPKEDTKYHVNEIIECGGGPAYVAATLLAKWGINTYFAGTVGNDTYGNIIENEMKEIGINYDYFRKVDHARTPNSFIIVNEQNGSRTLFNYTNKKLSLENVELAIKPDFILVDSYDAEFAKKVLLENKDVPSMIDAGTYKPESDELCRLVDYVVCSRKFAEKFAGLEINIDNFEDIKDIYTKLEAEYGANIVITLGKYGSIYKNNGEIKHMSAYILPPFDTTGAGDIFHGGFAYGIINEFDIEKTMKIATLAGALSVRNYGARYSIADVSEVMGLFDKNAL